MMVPSFDAMPRVEPTASVPQAGPWQRAANILVVRLDNLGDVLMSTPAIDAVKQRSPDMHVTLLASASGASLVGHVRSIDDAIVYDAPWMKSKSLGLDRDHQVIGRIAERRFDAAIILTVCTQSALPAALMCRLAGVPLRLAYSRENPYELLTDWRPEPDAVEDGMRHEVERHLDLVSSVGFATQPRARLQLDWTAAEAASAEKKLVAAGGDLRRRFVVVHPGATAPSRRYPPERFAAAADEIAEASGFQIVYCGSSADAELVKSARAAMRGPSLSLVGALGIGELAALIAAAEVVVCNNSAPAHIAAAVGTPVVVLYALTNPQHTPWNADSRVLFRDVECRHCLKSVCPQKHHDCLMKVTPGEVAQAAYELMAQRRRRP